MMSEPPVVRKARPTPQPLDAYETLPRSNRGVWLLLFMTVVIMSGCTLPCVGFAWVMFSPSLQPYVDLGGRFTASFPGDQVRTQTLASDGGTPIEVIYAERPAFQERFQIKIVPISGKKNADAAVILDDVMKSEAASAGVGYTESARETTTHDGYPALDVWLQGSGFGTPGIIFRCVRVGSVVYVLSAKGQNLVPQMNWVQRFFLTFRILGNEKLPPPK
jgi:hypothetical protein